MTIGTGTLTALVLVAGIMIYAIARLGELAYVELSRRGKARIIWWDEDGGELKIQFLERRGNEITMGKGADARTFILDAHARMPGRYPTWFVNPRHGWCYRAPSDAETVEKDKLLQVLSISNPAVYHKAIARNKARDALRANDDEDRWGWVMPVAVCAVAALVVVMGTVAWIAFKISNGAAPGGA